MRSPSGLPGTGSGRSGVPRRRCWTSCPAVDEARSSAAPSQVAVFQRARLRETLSTTVPWLVFAGQELLRTRLVFSVDVAPAVFKVEERESQRRRRRRRMLRSGS